jgi:CRISPR-associated protein Csm1
LENKNRQQMQEILINWAVEALGRWAGADELPASISPGAGEQLSGYGQLLSQSWKPDGKGENLLSIFSLVQPADGDAQEVEQVFVPVRPLSLETILPVEGKENFKPSDLWRDFVAEFGRLANGNGRFETFHHLFYKYTWAIPCTYGEAGVSLYEEFKALAALVHASGGAKKPADNFLLVGGDIPGIQPFVYTITSKGAAKGLRGRSFFLQLLGDAVVRRLVKDLGLCKANVIYLAGGNFTLLAPAGSETTLEEWQIKLNRTLLEEFEGDLYLAMAWENLPRSAVGTSGFADARERLGARVAAAKSQRFAKVVRDGGWGLVFQPQGQGGERYCQVCQREPRPGEKLISESIETGETVSKCAQCLGFEQLARDIAHHPLWMIVTETDLAKQEEKGWQSTLAQLTSFTYHFEPDPEKANGAGMSYILNPADSKASSAHGFHFIANVTPRIEERDRTWVHKHHPDLELPHGEPIKDFALMALQSEGIPRVGVLRMDVDNLGAIFGQYLRGSMAQVSALSAAMDLFFSGHLTRICRDVAGQGEHDNTVYIIYAGGDDLFAVGAWDRMPLMAERIRGDFAIHTGGNPYLTISGGVTLEGSKFPLYRAAERAGEAEGKAKAYMQVNGHDKDAFCFLGQVVAWGKEWELLRETERSFSSLVDAGVPRSLLRVAQILHAQFVVVKRRALRAKQEVSQKSASERLHWGRWAWMAAYSLTRLARGCPQEQKERILKIQREWIESGKRVHFLGLAARWTEYKMRGGEK